MMQMLLVVIGLLLSVSASAQTGTPMPIPLAQWLNNDGTPLSDGGLCVYNAGTTTLKTTYTTAALVVTNSNPILFDSAGRPVSGGVFLVPGQSYRFVLKDFSAVIGPPTCIPDSGVSLWTVDHVQAVPGSAGAVDVTATAGESIAAGDAVYVCTGSPCTNAGQLYKTDADNTTTSTNAALIGVAPNAITSGSTGVIRIVGEVTYAGGGLSPGQPYFLSSTAGGIGVNPATNGYRIGQAMSATVLAVGSQLTPVGPHSAPCGRLTLTSNTPVTSSDVTAATTVYYTPYGGCNELSLFNGTLWNRYAFTQLSIAVPASTNTVYDVFAYDNAGVIALELTQWTNDALRSTPLTTQSGVLVRSGAATRLYLGTFRTTGVSGQTEDSLARRLVWNYYQRVPRPLRKLEATDTWTYSTATFRVANNDTANRVDVLIGWQEISVRVDLVALSRSSGADSSLGVGIGMDSTTTPTVGQTGMYISTVVTWGQIWATLTSMPAVGYHAFYWLERGTGVNTDTWAGDNGLTYAQAGLSGWIDG